MNQLDLPIVPKPGEVFLYVCLSEIQNMTVTEALSLFEKMGYAPELRYRQSKSDNKVSLYALLKHERHDPESLIDSDYLADEWEALVQQIEPDTAVRCPRGLPKAKPVAA
ncbi:MAG: acyl carrier protein [Leptolyngbyaceae cyanobacterium RM2_2_4]|nr:acyl carrier protein [Leptolyngbyaceae cyanobacterium SM1_4_3]NJO51981.1 acyl carrier protein [Leptolyngbyaceae cyanobacterium RM2_2_4]NJO76152.1 acyl carrier protein [Leptolyngbyaceae cyanobacterium RM1_406_9]